MITTSIVLRINMVSSCLVKLFISEALLLLPKYMCTRTCMHIIYIYVYYFKCVYIYIYICTHIKPYKAVCLCAYMCVGVILTKCDDHIIITKNCVARGFSSLVMNFKFPRTNPQVWWQTNPRENINFLWLNSTTSWLVVSTQSEISAQFMASLFHAGWRKHVVPR